MASANDRSDDDLALSTGWSVTCGLVAALASSWVGNVPLTVIALGVTVLDLARRLPRRIASGVRGNHWGRGHVDGRL
jgi:hypothetical protein